MSDDAGSKTDSSGLAKAPAKEPAAPSKDVVLLGPPTSDGNGVHVLRARNERLEAGELRALREGQPITGEVVSLEPRQDEPRICDVRDSWSAPKGTVVEAHKGPAQVATSAYRAGWDEIFGQGQKSAETKSMSTREDLPKRSRDLN
ncbi:hypothetical protein AKJ09_02066 [Labilithrix luteola]|uniref:Uncharacterized protein n=1 Tax=Labilithrix luteola TaxID=1391654 RepID=A0A0K1PPG1_9BACT|nr:hypothetical protein [Labilithrix luteola]AKU95402.1 hypothetical protein AKJ09_02066 [Labilithrix luteola]